MAFAACSKPPLKKMFELPPFTLTEQSGQPFNSATMKGKVHVVCFFFAACPGPCLTLNTRIADIQTAMAGSPDVAFLSISTDETDTPEVLRNYAKARGAGEHWRFLTGKKNDVFDLSIKGFKLAVADAEGVNVEHKIIHSTKLVLIDRAGWIRGYYDGLSDKPKEETARLLADIKRLLAEK